MKARDMLVEFYDAADDDIASRDYDNTRRPRLTMAQLHRLRKAKDMERADNAAHMAFIPDMYNAAPEGESDTGL